jgi:cell division protein DivIC
MTQKKLTRKSKRRIFLICTVCIGLISLLAFNMFSVWGQMLEIGKEKKIYLAQLEELKDKEEELTLESNKLKDPEYIAKYAREQFLYSKDGEYNIRINNES